MSTPLSPSAEDGGPVHVETTVHYGSKATVVRDDAGNIVYPSYIPPATQPPPQAQHHGAATGPSKHQQEREHKDASDEPLLDGHGPAQQPPPPAVKRWATELPQSRSGSAPNGLRRAGTDIEKVAQAAPSSESPSSSSSESSDEEEDPTKKRTTRKKTHGKKTRGRGGDDEDDNLYRRFRFSNEHHRTKGKVSKRDGRLKISLHDTSNTGYLAKALGVAARKLKPTTEEPSEQHAPTQPEPGKTKTAPKPTAPEKPPPRLNIVIMVIGSRGDAQPFLKIARLLHARYGHRVRLATHPAFRDFVASDCPGVEFFPIGGDPSELMAFMVKNPGMIPTLESVRAGDVGRRRQSMAEIFEGCWRACVEPTGGDGSGGERRRRRRRRRGGEEEDDPDPFVADAIIANPPCFAHIHCAEALGIPVHLMFTFPFTPTQQFPHPLASVKKSNMDPGYTNWISYPLVEIMVWQGLGDLVNEFRVGTLGLDPVSTLWAPGATYRLHVPHTYLWSPGLVPKPQDWGEEIDIAGFVFLDLASKFEPPEELVKFLDEGDEPPVYIGFGSIVVDDADRFTQMIFDAVKRAGVRALVSKGWGGLGGDSLDIPDEIFMLENTPHDWLFPRVRACVIHGGAGTTAIALKCGKPTMIVPFFGDQHFWGSMVANAGAGPEPVPYKHLTAEKLADGIEYCITDDARKEAERIARDIEREGDGAENACRAFHRGLVLQGEASMRCAILPDRVAVWQMKKTGLRLSALAAQTLVERGLVSWKKLRLLRHQEWNDFEGPGEPLTGAAGSLMSSIGNIFRGVGGVPYRISKKEKTRKEKKKKTKANNGGKGADSGEGKQTPEDCKADGPAQQADSESDVHHAKLDRQDTASTTASNPAKNVVRQFGRGALKSASAIVRTPVDLCLALAQGFHNAPRLYGDDTVRRPTRVTGIRSGLRAGRREFVYGIYDGWTGVVRLPVRGARDEGVRGLISGVGMGLTGFVLKDIAAIIGPVAYTFQGLAKQAERRRRPLQRIRRARVLQGQRERSALSEDERGDKQKRVVAGWRLMRELWQDMKRAERKREKGVRRLKGSTEWNAVFENVDVAQRTLDALKRGDGLDTILEKGSDAMDTPGDKSSSSLDPGPGSLHGSVHDRAPDNATPGKPAAEDGNPFSATKSATGKNKAETDQTTAAPGIQAASA